MTADTALPLTRRLMSAIVSLVTIAAIVVGVPLVLSRLAGWPLPGEIPSSDGIGRALSRSTVSDATIVKAVALVGWFGWGMLCWSLLAESWAAIRGIPASRARLTGPFQGVARQLVASTSLLVATGMSSAAPATIAATTSQPLPLIVDLHDPVLATTSSAARAAPAVEPTAPEMAVPAPARGGPPAAAVPQATEPTPIPTVTTYTVHRRDSLWKIAECQLGDPLRWREQWALNRGRDFGGVTFTNPNLIYSGWVLELPTPAPTPAPALAPPVEPGKAPSPTPPPPSSDTLNTPRTEAATPELSDPATSPTTAVTPTTMGSTTTAASTTTPSRPSAPSETTAASTKPPPLGRDDATTDDDLVSTPSRAPLFAGGILLASAAIAVLTRLRRSQARRRPPGRPPHVPPTETAATEASLRYIGDPTRIHRAFAALRAFAAGLGDADMPPVAAVRVSHSEVEVLLASPAVAVPPGFACDTDHRVFTTEPEITTATLEGLAGEIAAPWPAVVAAGAVGDDLVLIDVETAGLLTADGPDAVDTVRRITAELATSPVSELIEVLVVGDGVDLAGSERIRTVATIDDAIKALDSASASTRAALERLGDPSTAIARRDHSAEQGWGVTVLVSMQPLTDSQRRRLLQVARPGHGVAAVVNGEPTAGAWSLTTGPTTRLEPHGFDLAPAMLSADELASIDELLADALTGDSNERLLVDDGPAETIYLPDVPEPATADDGPVIEVRVLGPVEVHGVDPINRRRTVELIAYLALHPGGVSPGRLKTAIWPASEPSQDTFNVTVHRARSALGIGDDGNHHLPHAVTNGGNYSVGPNVTTDLTRFNALVRRARAADDEAAEAVLLRRAIRLLRGQLFEGVSGYEWVFTEAIVTEAEATISDAAHRLAQLELAQGDAEAANWAAARGLLAVPGSEPLYRDRMEAAHLNGDPTAVDRIVDELCRYVETLEPLDDLHSDTIDLWRRLGRQAARQAHSNS